MLLVATDAVMRGAAPLLTSEKARGLRTLRALREGGGAPGAYGVERARVACDADRQSPIDLHELTRRFRGRREVVRKTLSLFREECGRLVEELRLFIDRADLVGATGAAHRLKGAAGSVSAHAVSDASGRIEDGCRHGRPDEVVAGFADLEREALRAVDQITGELTREESGSLGADIGERS